MAKMTPRTLSGFMELLPAPQQQMERMMDILRTTYSRYGFTPLDTPVIEASEVLLAKGGGETEKQIYRFTKGDSDLSLRFDLTVPLAKYVALHYADLAFPFRRFQIGKVYRGERAQRGRFREFYQADIDVIGDGELWGGVPARFIKKVDPEQAKELNVGYAQHYVMYSDWYRRSDAHPEHTHYCTTSEEYDEATRR